MRILKREQSRCLPTASVLSDTEISSARFEEFSVSTVDTDDVGEIKISIEVSGNRTQRTFDDVFQKMVEAAQPIPGFRRVKGGKTPNIPKDILLEVLGPSNVFKQVIKEIINSTVAEYVEKVFFRLLIIVFLDFVASSKLHSYVLISFMSHVSCLYY